MRGANMRSQPSFQIRNQTFETPPAEPGLYLVSTPIGNLRDITIRALETLAGCDLIACEDTRVTVKLLNHYSISAKTLAYHEHNAKKTIILMTTGTVNIGCPTLLPDCHGRMENF